MTEMVTSPANKRAVAGDSHANQNSMLLNATLDEDDAQSDINMLMVQNFEGELKKMQTALSKKKISFHKNQTSMTVLGYLKFNQEKYMLSPARQAMNFYSTIYVYIFQNIMLGCILAQIIYEQNTKIPPYLRALLVKFPCSVALHLNMTPDID